MEHSTHLIYQTAHDADYIWHTQLAVLDLARACEGGTGCREEDVGWYAILWRGGVKLVVDCETACQLQQHV